jgi:hypothetical protein
VQKGAQAATRPITALVGVSRRGDDAGDRRQESALAGGAPADVASRRADAGVQARPAPSLVAAAPGDAHPKGNGHTSGLTSGGPARRNGSAVNATQPSNGHVQPAPATGHPAVDRPAATPRTAHEDVMRRARELRERGRVADRHG